MDFLHCLALFFSIAYLLHNMTKTEAQEEITSLSEKIRYYNQKYYQDSVSEISDYEFDQLLNRLIELEATYPEFLTEDSPSQRVGGAIIKLNDLFRRIGISQRKHRIFVLYRIK